MAARGTGVTVNLGPGVPPSLLGKQPRAPNSILLLPQFLTCSGYWTLASSSFASTMALVLTFEPTLPTFPDPPWGRRLLEKYMGGIGHGDLGAKNMWSIRCPSWGVGQPVYSKEAIPPTGSRLLQLPWLGSPPQHGALPVVSICVIVRFVFCSLL